MMFSAATGDFSDDSSGGVFGLGGAGGAADGSMFNLEAPRRGFGEPRLEAHGERDASAEGDEFDDEAPLERLEGLTEMFPAPVQNALLKSAHLLGGVGSATWRYGRKFGWLLSTTAVILLLPALFERERWEMQNVSLLEQRQLMLGPGASGLPAAPALR